MRPGNGAGGESLRDFDALCRSCNGTWYPGKRALRVRMGTGSRDPFSLYFFKEGKKKEKQRLRLQ